MKDQKQERCHDESVAQESTAAGTEQEQSVNEPQNIEAAENKNEQATESKENPEEKIALLNDKYLRLAAEFDNYRRRTAKERLDLVMTAAEETIKGLLPVLDDCERAIEVLKSAEGDHKAAIEGTELIYNKLYSYLETKGLKKIEVKGKELDTDFHEAVAQFPAPDKKHRNKIVDVAQHGYTLNGKVIRFAKVVVGI